MAKKEKFSGGGTSRTDMNRRLGEVLQEIILIRKATEQAGKPGGGGGSRVGKGGPTDVSKLALEATQLLLAREATLATRASEATLATRASETTLTTRASEATLATRASEATLATRATETTLATRATETTLASRATETTQLLLGRETTLATRATETTQLLLGRETTLSTRASEATLLLKATEATQLLLATATNQTTQIGQQTAGGQTTAEWLEDIDDGIDTLIFENDANFALNIAEMGIQTGLNIAQLIINAGIGTANGLLQLAANGKLDDIVSNTQGIEDNTAPASGTTIAEWLEDIDENTDTLEALLAETGGLNITEILANQDTNLDAIVLTQDNIVELLEDLTFPEADVDSHTLAPITDNFWQIRPDSTAFTCFVHHVQIFNNHAVFPVSFKVRLRDGAGNKAERPDLVAIISPQVADTIVLNMNIRRNCFLEIEASFDAAHIFNLAYLNSGAVTISDHA